VVTVVAVLKACKERTNAAPKEDLVEIYQGRIWRV